MAGRKPVQNAGGGRRPRGGTGPTGLRPKTYPLLEQCVENGLRYGVTRLFKHRSTSTISEQALRSEEAIDTFCRAIMSEICEWFDFAETADEGWIP